MKDSQRPFLYNAVVISGTDVGQGDLQQLVFRAATAGGLFSVMADHKGADWIVSSLNNVAQAAGYVLLIGHRYGQQPASAELNPNQLSITELEFDKAIECGRPVVVFMLSQSFPRSGGGGVDQDEMRAAKLAAFRQRVESLHGQGCVRRVVSSQWGLEEAATVLLTRQRFQRAPASPAPAARAQVPLPALPPSPAASKQALPGKPHEAWDVFISHASEDKASFVAPLASALKARGVNVWFDTFTLSVGDGLRGSIDQGLARSRFGIVVLSEAYFSKRWPKLELDGLVARESEGQKVILPVWHEIDEAGVRYHSPMLADKVAVLSAHGIDHAVEQLLQVIKPAAPGD